MKLVDLLNENEEGFMNSKDDDSSNSFGNLSRKPRITLKHIHKLKKMQAEKMAEYEKRQELISVMYALPSGDE